MTFKRIIPAAFCVGLLAAPAFAQVTKPVPAANSTIQPPGKTPLGPGNPYRGDAGPGTQPRDHQGANIAQPGYGLPPPPGNPNVAPTPDQ
jgi:hypothetical protein